MGVPEGPEEEDLDAELMFVETVEYEYLCWESIEWSRAAWRLLLLDITYGA